MTDTQTLETFTSAGYPITQSVYVKGDGTRAVVDVDQQKRVLVDLSILDQLLTASGWSRHDSR
jgi:hypothetical protein